ncbi:MAG: GAF domain-containing protein [Coriobacteriia bacterium]|nr:GAF domain-containing protein [Coriobacteriia bacterium]
MSQHANSSENGQSSGGKVAAGVAAIVVVAVTVGLLRSTTAGIIAATATCVVVWLVVRSPGSTRESLQQLDTAPVSTALELPRVPPTLEPDVVIRTLMEACGTVGRPVAAHLWLEDPSSGTLRLIHAAGPMAPSAQPVSLEDAILGAACREMRATLGQLARVRTMDRERLVWRYALPLSAGESCGVAAVDIESAEEPDGERLAQCTAPVRGALSGALAVHVARTEMDLARNLVEVARDLSRVLDPEEVLAMTLERAIKLCDAATSSIMLLDEEQERLVISKAHGLPQDVVEGTSIAAGEGIAGWVLSTGQPLLIEDLPAQQRPGRRHGVRSAVSVPLGDDDGILGVINVGSRTFPARFTDSHLRALETLGKQAAVALRNARAVNSSRDLYFDTLRALSLALETKDPYASGGTDRVIEYATAIGEAFGLREDQQEALRIAALLHDIGMSMVGETLLTESRPLSTVEQALLKMHPQVAMEVLQQAPALHNVAPIVYHHHEWFDGHGYLGGLAGEAIPLGARILAVADAFVAMTSDRPYRGAMTESEALAELKDKAGTQFDPAVVNVLTDILGGRLNRVPEERR